MPKNWKKPRDCSNFWNSRFICTKGLIIYSQNQSLEPLVCWISSITHVKKKQGSSCTFHDRYLISVIIVICVSPRIVIQRSQCYFTRNYVYSFSSRKELLVLVFRTLTSRGNLSACKIIVFDERTLNILLWSRFN